VQVGVGVGAGEVFEEGEELPVAVPVVADPGYRAGGDLQAANSVVVPCRT
jgi:hypothetical protein